MCRMSVVSLVICFIVSAAAAQSPPSAASKADSLSLEQKTRISKLITKQTAPLNSTFSIAVGGLVPSEVPLHSLPSGAEELAPQLRGLRYVVVEELVAIVEPHTRRIEIVFPRWGGE